MVTDREYGKVAGAIRRAVSEWAQAMLGEAPDFGNDGDRAASDLETVVGMMFLSGGKALLLMVTIDRKTLTGLVRLMAGDQPERPEELADGMAEITNIIAGSVKTILAGSPWHFSIAPPLVVSGRELGLYLHHRLQRITVRAGLSGGSVTVELIAVG
ncbi:MAG: chemotaxis protein CheX [Negativicutes bacterium]|nr:chemotaxis protein CheX [Negativicutes bacterium]